MLCELKIASDNPLYAMMELTTYVFGYLIIRKLAEFLSDKAYERIRNRSNKLISAQVIDWTVVAPKAFYEARGVRNLPLVKLEQVRRSAESHITEAAQELGLGRVGLTIGLRALELRAPLGPFSGTHDRDDWISAIRGTSTLRKMILQASPIK